MIYSHHYINPAEVGRHCAYTLLEAETAQKREEERQKRIKDEIEKYGAKGGVNTLFNKLMYELGLAVQYSTYSGMQLMHTGFSEEEVVIKLRKILEILENNSYENILWSCYSNSDLENMSNRYMDSDLARELLQWRKLYPGVTKIIKPTIHEMDKEIN